MSQTLFNPRVSIVVPVYNVKNYLDRCMESLVAQTFRDVEIIVVDDGSTDGSGAMCDAWAIRDSRVIVLHKPNGGLSDARNAGVAHARAPYVTFVDSDDYAAPEMVEVLYESCRAEGADIAVCGICEQFASRSEVPPRICRRVMTPSEALADIFITETMMVCIPARLYPLSLMKEVLSPVGKAHEDAFMVVELFSRVDKVVVDTQPLYHYWHNEGTITSASFCPRDMDLIEAWDRNAVLVKERFPELQEEVDYRCYRARFEVLDKMVIAPAGCVDPLAKAEVINYLMLHRKKILDHPALTRARKISLLALFASEKIYKALVVLQGRRMNYYN